VLSNVNTYQSTFNLDLFIFPLTQKDIFLFHKMMAFGGKLRKYYSDFHGDLLKGEKTKT